MGDAHIGLQHYISVSMFYATPCYKNKERTWELIHRIKECAAIEVVNTIEHP